MPAPATDVLERCITFCERFMQVAYEVIEPENRVHRDATVARQQLRDLKSRLALLEDQMRNLTAEARHSIDILQSQANQAHEKIRRLPHPEDVELAIMANGNDCCNCDASVGQCPCQWCAIDSVLHRLLRVVKPSPVRRRIRSNVVMPDHVPQAFADGVGHPIIRVGNYGTQNVSFGAGALRSMAAEHPECLTYNDAERTLYYHGTLPVTMTADCPGVQMTFNRALQ